jgi:peptide/nickel transport system permease protein
MDFFRRLSKNKGAFVSMFVIIIIVLACVFANVISPYDYGKQDLISKCQMPSLKHICGTDNYGRDIFTRILYGGRVSLLVSLVSVAISTIVGPIFGAISAFYGKTVDSIVMRLLDIIMSIPGLLLSVSISIALGTGIVQTAIAIAVGSIPSMARVMRAQVLTEKDKEYVEAARAAGATDLQIIFTHIVPNCLAPLIVQATMRIGSSVLLISSLSFIGCGIQPPTPEWGSMVSAGREYVRTFYPMVLYPGLAIMITMLAFNMFGDGVRDALDPKLRQ